MKYKLKTRLFAALALSGASFCWPATTTFGQDDDYGFIQAIESASGTPNAQASRQLVPQPPIVTGHVPTRAQKQTALMPQASHRPSPSANAAPMPFASSNVFGGTYVPQSATSAAKQAAFENGSASQSNVRQVGFNSNMLLPQTQNGVRAERDVPPIITTSSNVGLHQLKPVPVMAGPVVQNEMPPIVSAAQNQSEIVTQTPPVVSASDKQALLAPISSEQNEGSAPQLLPPIQFAGEDASMVESSYLVNAAGDASDEVGSVQATGFGESPLAMQDAPPIFAGDAAGAVQASPSDLFGRQDLPNGLNPIDPVMPEPVQLPSASPVDMGHMMSSSNVGSGESVQSYSMDTPVFNSVVGESVSGCQNCGTGGCYNPSDIAGTFNSCGCNSMARRYLIAEALYFDRDDGFINNSNFGTLNNFDPEAGWRFTVGRRTDSTRGREISYMGTLALEQTRQAVQPGGLIQSRFVPSDGFNASNMRGFFNATQQSQAKETFFHSLEVNRVKWGWDVMKSFIGLRYFLVDDSYSMYSQSAAVAPSAANPAGIPAEQAFFQMDAVNHLIGPHIGGELYYDVGYRWSLSGFSKAGIYANLNQFDTRLVSNGVTFVDAEDNNATISTSYEAGLMAKYRLTQQAQFRVGYNILWLGEMGTVSDNLANRTTASGIALTPTIGSGTSDSDDMFFHGFSFGFELYR